MAIPSFVPPERAGDSGSCQEVAALSAGVLRGVRLATGESQARFAARVGVGLCVVTGAEDGTTPAWALPSHEFAALAVAASDGDPWLHELFQTAAACDLLLSSVLDGDQAFATDVLTDSKSRRLAQSLLRLAMTGIPYSQQAADCPPPGVVRPVLSAYQLARLAERAAALAGSDSPDAWVGAELCSCIRSTS